MEVDDFLCILEYMINKNDKINTYIYTKDTKMINDVLKINDKNHAYYKDYDMHIYKLLNPFNINNNIISTLNELQNSNHHEATYYNNNYN